MRRCSTVLYSILLYSTQYLYYTEKGDASIDEWYRGAGRGYGESVDGGMRGRREERGERREEG